MRVKINNNNYDICFVNPNDENLKMSDGEYHSGVTDFITKTIYISNVLIDDSLRYTIIHELTHAMIDSYGFLQVDWDDEIVADFVGNYLPNIINLLDKIETVYENKK